MIRHYPFNTLGHADHGWLQARHHFSFARYHNPARQHFGALRVINDDRIAAGTGFGTHPHDNMEIITYVRAGAISHKDSMGHAGRTGPGDVQVMSAGTGIFHSEYNLEPEETTLYQIWIEPNAYNIAPRWQTRAFPKAPVAADGSLPLLVSGQPEHADDGALFIQQDAAIYGGTLRQGATLKQSIKHQAYLLASLGSFTVNGLTLAQGDGAEVTGEKQLIVTALTDAEILVIDVPNA